MEKTSFDPTRRRLCPDGACIGVIGADGRCRECGKTDDGKPVEMASASAALSVVEDDVERADEHEHEPADEHADEGEKLQAGGFDPKRRLCDDGACIGVIEASGVCSVCGKRPEG